MSIESAQGLRIRSPWVAVACMLFVSLGAGAAFADDPAPTNAELYRMILELRADQQRLIGEAASARAEAQQAREQLSATQQELEQTRARLEQTQREGEAPAPPPVAAPAPEQAQGFVREANLQRGLSVFAEANIMRFTDSQSDFATLTTDEATLFGTGSNKIVQSAYDTGYTIGAGYAFGGPRDLEISYEHLDNNQGSKLIPPFETPDANPFVDLIAILAPPAFGQGATSATSTLDWTYTAFEAMASENLDVGEKLGLRLSGGVRYVHSSEHQKAFYFGEDFPVEVGSDPNCDVQCGIANSDFNFWGVGPRVALGGRYHLPWGFNIFGATAASLLVGESEAELGFQLEQPGGDEFVAFIHRDFGVRVFPEIEMKAGLGWEYALPRNWGNFFVDAGYEFKNYFNVVERFKFNDVGNPASFNENTTDLALDGIFVRSGFKFNGP
jgi:hypothetical protein